MNITGSNIAFMIRNDGAVYPVTQHYYGNRDIEDVEETIYAGEWLYDHTRHNSTKELYIKLLKAWIYKIYGDNSNQFNTERMLLAFKTEIDSRSYKFLSYGFVQSHIEEIMNADVLNLSEVNDVLCEELNQEFLRARYGGMYNSSHSTSGEMVFRISSTDFNWFDIIWAFVYTNKSKINTVTIVADEESTGKNFYYKENGITFDNCPVDDFINLSGNPVFESLDSLMEGKSIIDSMKNMNYGRVAESYCRLRYRNIGKFSLSFKIKG